MLPSTPLNPALYPRGTLVAAAGLLTVACYYHHIWGLLKNLPESQAVPAPIPNFPDPQAESAPFLELNYLYCGLAISVLTFLLAGSADTPPTPLDHLLGALMGLCGTLFAAMFAVGLICVWNLWKEAIQQLKGAKIGALILSTPLALLGLALGVGVFIALGMLVDKIPKYLESLARPLMLGVIAAMFYALWKGRSHAALALRLVLLLAFSSIILAAIVWGLWWIASQTAPLLVTFLAAMTVLHAAFYARWVRLKALANNMQ